MWEFKAQDCYMFPTQESMFLFLTCIIQLCLIYSRLDLVSRWQKSQKVLIGIMFHKILAKNIFSGMLSWSSSRRRTIGHLYLLPSADTVFSQRNSVRLDMLSSNCCGQLWVWHMFWGQDLWWTIPLHIFHWLCWDATLIPTDHMDHFQTRCKQVPDFSRLRGQVVIIGPTGLHGLCFGCALNVDRNDVAIS